MLETVRAFGGMATAPHHLAARAGARVLAEGGNAVEAAVSMAAAIAVVYPHMNGLGGDNFWIIHRPGMAPIGIDACGAAADAANLNYYVGLGAIPSRGPKAALTVAGAVSGWQQALALSNDQMGGTLTLARLLEDAIHYAENGSAVTRSLQENIRIKAPEMAGAPGFATTYKPGGRGVGVGERLCQPALATTLRRLAKAGLDDFYRGDLGHAIGDELAAVGSPLTSDDLARHQALTVAPLSVDVAGHQVFNMPPPTQGLASLMLLAIYDRLGVTKAEGFDFVHGLVEATKQAFRVRDRHIGDPAYMTVEPNDFLAAPALDAMAADIDRDRAAPWPDAGPDSDTVWFAAMDAAGNTVSMIQSLYWEFGSGVVLPGTGITWQNRGTSFSLDPGHHNVLKPGRRPFHTIQPALAHLSDGRVMAYGTMGGEGQPQTQAMVFARHVLHGQDLQQAVTAPRWLLGRTWGTETTSLRIEDRIGAEVIAALRAAGHDVEVTGPFDEVMGHAGGLVHHTTGPLAGLMEGATDPRSDGAVAAL